MSHASRIKQLRPDWEESPAANERLHMKNRTPFLLAIALASLTTACRPDRPGLPHRTRMEVI